MSCVLVTRPEPGATRTLNALSAQGFAATAIPLTEVHPLAFRSPRDDFDGVIITSQNAIMYGAALLMQHISKPVFVVGMRTAETMPGHNIVAWAETADNLLPEILSHAPSRLLYICGQTRKPELEKSLAAANIHVEAVEVYAATPTKNGASSLHIFLASTRNLVVLFHAPSAVKAFMKAATNQNLSETTRFLCMSAAIAAELPVKWQSLVSLADRPEETAMINQLDKMLARDHMPKA
jgi:uroporphyrinogen-III synthase